MKQAVYNYGTGWKVSQMYFSSKEEAEESLNLRGFLNYQLIWPARFMLVEEDCGLCKKHNCFVCDEEGGHPTYELELVVP